MDTDSSSLAFRCRISRVRLAATIDFVTTKQWANSQLANSKLQTCCRLTTHGDRLFATARLAKTCNTQLAPKRKERKKRNGRKKGNALINEKSSKFTISSKTRGLVDKESGCRMRGSGGRVVRIHFVHGSFFYFGEKESLCAHLYHRSFWAIAREVQGTGLTNVDKPEAGKVAISGRWPASIELPPWSRAWSAGTPDCRFGLSPRLCRWSHGHPCSWT